MTTELQEKFIGGGEVAGFEFTKVFESEVGFVFKVETETGTHFEAFLRKEVPVCIDFNKRLYSETEKKVVYPNSKNFGVWAWCVRSLDAGINKLELATQKQNNEKSTR